MLYETPCMWRTIFLSLFFASIYPYGLSPLPILQSLNNFLPIFSRSIYPACLIRVSMNPTQQTVESFASTCLIFITCKPNSRVTSPDSISCVRAESIASETDIRFLIRWCLFVVETARKLTCRHMPLGEVTCQRNWTNDVKWKLSSKLGQLWQSRQ